MRIRRLTIHGFGNLKGDFIFSSDRCNLILEPNEAGKSTLAAAILAGLYGFPRERASRDRPIKTKERYRPWGASEGPFGLEMDVERGDRTFSIHRDFSQDSVRVIDARTGKDVTAEFSRGRDAVDVGEALCGLSREDFARCCFVGQRDLEALREAEGITHALQRIASSQHGDVAAGEALAALGRAVDQEYQGLLLGKGKVETEIRRLEGEIDRLTTEMEGIAARRRQSDEKIRRLEEARRKERELTKGLARADALHIKAALAEARAAAEECRRDAEEMAGHRKEEAELLDYASFPSDKLGRLREIKGMMDSLAQSRAAASARLDAEVDPPLARAREQLAALGPLGALSDSEAGDAAARVAVLEDLWRHRREKKRAMRQERRRLRGEGTEPAKVTELEKSLSGLSDQDRRFIATQRERHLELKAALADAERRRDRLMQEETGQRLIVPLAAHYGKERLALIIVAMGVVLSALLPFLIESRIPIVVTGLLALGGLLWWLHLLEKRPVHGAEQFGSELQKAQTEVWSLEKDLAQTQDRLARLALRENFESAERLVEEYRELSDLREKSRPLANLEEAVTEAGERYARAARGLSELMARAGNTSARPLTPRGARRFRDRLAEARETRAHAARLNFEREGLGNEVAQLGVKLAMIEEEASSILSQAFGQGAGQGVPEELMARFEEGAAHRLRLEHLRRELIPTLLRRHADPPDRRAEKLGKEVDVLARQAARLTAHDPSLEQAIPTMSSREHAEERRRIQEEARKVQSERIDLAEELNDLLKEYRRDYPERLTRLESLQKALERAIAFRDAVAVASDVLSNQSEETYAEWAGLLNEKTSHTLARLNPEYDDVRFDTDLSFTLRHVRSGQRLDQKALDAHASAGARDQVYLAVRLAVSEFLSATGVRLPFVLDDPFASFDDGRFTRAMEFLLDVASRQHQIIVLSCHEARHRLWRESSAPPLTERLRVIDLTPLSA